MHPLPPVFVFRSLARNKAPRAKIASLLILLFPLPSRFTPPLASFGMVFYRAHLVWLGFPWHHLWLGRTLLPPSFPVRIDSFGFVFLSRPILPLSGSLLFPGASRSRIPVCPACFS